MAYDYRWYKKDIESMRNLTKGTMPLTRVCKDKEELSRFKEASKGMRGIKNIDFKIEKKKEK